MLAGFEEQRTATNQLRADMDERFNNARVEAMRSEANLYNKISAGDTRLHNEISDLRTEMRVSLMEKPSKTYLWSTIGVLIAAYAAGLAGLAALR